MVPAEVAAALMLLWLWSLSSSTPTISLNKSGFPRLHKSISRSIDSEGGGIDTTLAA